ncbi:MAG: bacteriocin ABC transporter ATP-binding protein [Epulopiscium sp. Nele67-Bin001]|nr:MAG: bacteriocin ABC transporter ATP-binding protein [Epulopiscium sp. Nele67-Bin001]
MINLTNINKAYGNNVIFKNFSLQIEDKAFAVITGQSGKGKTTLMNIMGLIETIDGGTITLDNIEVKGNKNKLLFFREKIAFLFQNFALIDELTVEKNLLLALEYSSYNKTEKVVKINQVLAKVGLKKYNNMKVYQLSGGQQQRVALARVILKDAKYVFADEPTGNLDEENANLVFKLLHDLNSEGKTIVVVTHNPNVVTLPYVTQVVEL